jgi:hypothetical protein
MHPEWLEPGSLSTVENEGGRKIEYFIQIFDLPTTLAINLA